jgi:hypothetical protein
MNETNDSEFALLRKQIEMNFFRTLNRPSKSRHVHHVLLIYK